MPYEIFDVKKENRSKIDAPLQDDIVSRQSILVREAKVLELKEYDILVLIEGDDKALQKAKELFSEIGKTLEGPDKEMVYKKFKDEEGEVLGGMGLIFGG
jgi:hypothetical protein